MGEELKPSPVIEYYVQWQRGESTWNNVNLSPMYTFEEARVLMNEKFQDRMHGLTQHRIVERTISERVVAGLRSEELVRAMRLEHALSLQPPKATP